MTPTQLPPLPDDPFPEPARPGYRRPWWLVVIDVKVREWKAQQERKAA